MTEDEYITITDLAKTRIAVDVIRSIMQDERQDLLEILYNITDRLEKNTDGVIK